MPYAPPATDTYDAVTIQGVATVAAGDLPLADPNIEVLADDVYIHDFTIMPPVYVSGYYSSGIVVGGANFALYNNDIYGNTVDSIDDVSQSLQTYSSSAMPGVDISGLNIHDNNFLSTDTGTWGYEAIYVNQDAATSDIFITDNSFSGDLLRAITVERDHAEITGNLLVSNLIPGNLPLPVSYQGINLGNVSDILIDDNQIGDQMTDDINLYGFYQGIKIGSTVSDIVITNNEILANTTGIFINSTSGIVVEDNEIYSNDMAIYFPAGDISSLLDADNNWWGDESGPYNATYNPQGLGNAVSEEVDFSHWWESVEMTQETSSAYAIYYAMGNDTEYGTEGTDVTLSNFASPANGTITFDVGVDYPTPWNVNLPHELMVDALIHIDPVPPVGTTITLNGVISYEFDELDDGYVWMSEFDGAVDRPALYLDNDWSGSVVVEGLDDEVYTFTIASIASEDFAGTTLADYDDDIVDSGSETNYDFIFDNYYRDYDGNGFVLDSESATIVDPMQYFITNTSLEIINIASQVTNEITFDVEVDYPDDNGGYVPTLSTGWYADAWIEINPGPKGPIPEGSEVVYGDVYLDVYYNGNLVKENFEITNVTEIYLSEILESDPTPLIGHYGLVDTWSFVVTGLDSDEYDLTVTSRARNSFPTEVTNEYDLATNSVEDIVNPIQYAIDNTEVYIQDETLANTTDGTITFDVMVDYPPMDVDLGLVTWTSNPELPTDLLVDALIATDVEVPVGTMVEVFFDGVSLGTYTTTVAGENQWWFSEIISGTPNRPALKDEVSDLSWTVEISNLDDQIREFTISSVASDFVETDDFVNEYVLGTDAISIQDPVQVALNSTLETTSLTCDVEDTIEWTLEADHPVFREAGWNHPDESVDPPINLGWLYDIYVHSDTPFNDDTVLEIWWDNDGTGSVPVGIIGPMTYANGFWIGEQLQGPGLIGFIGHELYYRSGKTDTWTIYITGADATEYDVDLYYCAAASGNFVDPTTLTNYGTQTSQTMYVLDTVDQTIQDPIVYTQDVTTLSATAPATPTDGAIEFTATIDYPDAFPTNPALPIDPDLDVDAALYISPALGQDTQIYLSYEGTNLGNTTLNAGTEYVWLSEVITAINGALPVRTPLLGHENRIDDWGVMLTGLDYEDYTITIKSYAADTFPEEPPALADPMVSIYQLGNTLTVDFTVPILETLQISTFDGTNVVSTGGTYTPGDPSVGTYPITLDPEEPGFALWVTDVTANTAIKPGLYGFYLDTTRLPEDKEYPDGDDYSFYDYWADRNVTEAYATANPDSWQAAMWQIINGLEPICYLKYEEAIDDNGFTLIDGMHYLWQGTEEYFGLEGTYFTGDYTVIGQIQGANNLWSDPIEITLEVTDNDTYPEFTTLNLQDQVQDSDYWIDLEEYTPRGDATGFGFTMYLNSDVDYYDINIKDDASVNFYEEQDLASGYYPFYLNTEWLFPEGFDDYWDAKGVNASAAPGSWQEHMYDIITGEEPMFYLKVEAPSNGSQNYMLVDGLMFDYFEQEQYLQVDGDYPLGEYNFYGEVMGVNGSISDEIDIYITFEEAEVVAYDLIIWEDYENGIQITEHDDVADEDINMVVDQPYDITVNAIDVNQVIVSDYSDETILFGTNYDAYVQMTNWAVLQNGTLYLENAIRSLHEINDPMLYVSITGELFDSIVSSNGGYIVEPATINIAAPTCFTVEDVTPDQGGFVFATICRSPNDPFYSEPVEPYIDHYTIERQNALGDWEWFESIDCYDNGSDTIVTGPLATIASDDPVTYRISAVYVPNSDNTISKAKANSKLEGPTDEGIQSDWVVSEPVAAADNIPAYADFKVYMEGPYIGSGVMQDGQTKPLTSPYDGETITALPLPSEQIIDWVQIQLRETVTGATVKQANAFLLTDGSIVDVEGNYSLPFYYTTGEEYYIVIHHRNHLDIMTATTWEFSDSPVVDTVIDLSVAGSVYDDGFKEVEDGVYAMISGDANNSNLVNGVDAIEIINNLNSTTYNDGDLNLSGLTNGADAIEIINNLNAYGTVPNPGTDVVAMNKKDTNRAGEDCTLEITNVNVVPGVSYSFDVYITRNASWTTNTAIGTLFGTFNSSCVFNITNNAFANPVISNLGSPINDVVVTFPGDILGVDLISSGLEVPTTPTLLFSVSLDIANPNTTAGLQWSHMDTGIYDSSNLFGYLSLELLGGDNSTLPVVLSSFTANYVAQFDHVELNWVTASEDGNAGWNLYRGESEDAMANGEVMLLNQGLIPGAGTVSTPTYYEFIDDNALAGGQEYWYWLESVDQGGEVYIYDPVSMAMPVGTTPELPSVTMLKGNYPNPFNPATEIAYSIKEGETGVLSIYNAKGQKVHSTTLQAGNGSYRWEANEQASGIYFYRLKTDSYNDIKKMMLLK